MLILLSIFTFGLGVSYRMLEYRRGGTVLAAIRHIPSCSTPKDLPRLLLTSPLAYSTGPAGLTIIHMSLLFSSPPTSLATASSFLDVIEIDLLRLEGESYTVELKGCSSSTTALCPS